MGNQIDWVMDPLSPNCNFYKGIPNEEAEILTRIGQALKIFELEKATLISDIAKILEKYRTGDMKQTE